MMKKEHSLMLRTLQGASEVLLVDFSVPTVEFNSGHLYLMY